MMNTFPLRSVLCLLVFVPCLSPADAEKAAGSRPNDPPSP